MLEIPCIIQAHAAEEHILSAFIYLRVVSAFHSSRVWWCICTELAP